MSSNISRPLILALEPDRTVIGTLAVAGTSAVASIASAPLDAPLRAGLALLAALVTIRVVGTQFLSRQSGALRRLVLRADGVWLLQFGDGRCRLARHLDSSQRLGRWWFLRWPGAWTVVTASGIGERAWRQLTARLRDEAAAGPRTASSGR